MVQTPETPVPSNRETGMVEPEPEPATDAERVETDDDEDGNPRAT